MYPHFRVQEEGFEAVAAVPVGAESHAGIADRLSKYSIEEFLAAIIKSL